MDFFPLAAAIALIWKIVDFAKVARVRDWNAVLTQVVVWGAGVGVTFLLAGTDFADGINIGGRTLGGMNSSSVILLGLSMGSLGSVAVDYKKARDNNDSAAMPTLLTGEVPVGPPVLVDADAPEKKTTSSGRRRSSG